MHKTFLNVLFIKHLLPWLFLQNLLKFYDIFALWITTCSQAAPWACHFNITHRAFSDFLVANETTSHSDSVCLSHTIKHQQFFSTSINLILKCFRRQIFRNFKCFVRFWDNNSFFNSDFQLQKSFKKYH